MVKSFVQDVRYALRMFLKSPGFSAIVVTTLALGIGANTAVFSVVKAVALGTRGISERERVVYVFTEWPDDGVHDGPVSVPDFIDLRERNNSFVDLGIYSYANFNLSGDGRPERVQAVSASASVLSILGFDAKVGRVFGPDEEDLAAEPVAVLSDSFWQRRFGADPKMVGQTIVFDGAPVTVVGILPPKVEQAWGRFDVWVPLRPDPADYPRGRFSCTALGRLKPGVSITQAETEMNGIAARIAEADPGANQDLSINLMSMVDVAVKEDTRSALSALLVGAGLLLLIACVNVANLLLAKGTERRREFAIRAAVGAGQWRLARQTIVECGLLALAGGTMGVLLAAWGVDVMASALSDTLPRTSQITVDFPVLAFALVVSALCALVFGLIPAMGRSHAGFAGMLKEGASRATGDKRTGRGRELLVVGQLAMALALVTCAGLMIKSVLRLTAVDPGFERRNLLTMRVTPQGPAYENPDRRAAFFEDSTHRIRRTPGVTSAAAASYVPLEGRGTRMSFTVEEKPAGQKSDEQFAGFTVVTPGYFQTMGIPILAGRDFTELDKPGTEGVVIVNRALAELLSPGKDPVGRRLKYAARDTPAPWLTVVGVVGDVRHDGLDHGFRHETYRPLAQQQQKSITFVARTAGDPMRSAPAVRNAIWELDRDLAVYRVQSMEDIAFSNTGESGVLAKLLGLFAAIALVLGGVGLYGVISYTVNRRTKEIGIRMALGAQRLDVLRMVISRSVFLVLLGLLGGVALSLVIGHSLESLMYGVSATDPVTFFGATGVLVVMALFANYIPARRATKVDPIVALRCE